MPKEKKIVAFYIERDTLDKFDRKAREEDKNRSAVVNRLMRRYLGGK